MTRRSPAASHEHRVTFNPALNAELARLWADKPAPLEVPEHGTPRPRSVFDDRLDAWLRDFIGGEQHVTR